MAKTKIIWSRKAKKKLYLILESMILKKNKKSEAIAFHKSVRKEVKFLRKHPETGIATTFIDIKALILDTYFILFEISGNKIVIHTIGDLPKKIYA